MAVGIRTRDLRKIYNSSPPFAAGAGGFVSGALGRKPSKQPKPEIVALDGLSLDIFSRRDLRLVGTERRRQVDHGGNPHHARAADQRPGLDR